MIIKTKQLRRAANLLLDHLEQNGVREIRIEEEHYWSVPEASRYDAYAEPTEHTLGQLSDDWAEVSAMLAASKPPIGYGLVWLAAILRRAGETSIG